MVGGGFSPVAFQEVGPKEGEVSVDMQGATVEQPSAGVPKFPLDFNCPHLDLERSAQVRNSWMKQTCDCYMRFPC